MRQTRRDRNILWGWVDLNGNVKGGNCIFNVQRSAVGQYLITLADGLPQPCSIVTTCISSGAVSPVYSTHNIFPTTKQFKIIVYGGTTVPAPVVDSDFYWQLVGS